MARSARSQFKKAKRRDLPAWLFYFAPGYYPPPSYLFALLSFCPPIFLPSYLFALPSSTFKLLEANTNPFATDRHLSRV